MNNISIYVWYARERNSSVRDIAISLNNYTFKFGIPTITLFDTLVPIWKDRLVKEAMGIK